MMWKFTGASDSDRHSAVNLTKEEEVVHVLAIIANKTSDFMDETGPLPFNLSRLSDLVSLHFSSSSCLYFIVVRLCRSLETS